MKEYKVATQKDIALKHKSLRSRHFGAATLLFAVAALTINTMMVIFAANYGNLQDKSVSNQNRSYQAQTAANAGLDYGVVYLKSNGGTILANPVGGYIQPYSDSNISNVTLPNNSRFTVTYSNPIQNNYDLIMITSTGSSDDGTALRVVSQLFQGSSGSLANSVDAPLIVKGEADYAGNGTVINTFTNQTIRSGGDIDLKGNAQTETASGVSSTSSTNGPDITENDSSLSGLTNDQFFNDIFGDTTTNIQNSADTTYTNSNPTNYSSALDGMTGSIIWINQTGGKATLSGNTVIGSVDNPVVLIINGEAQFTGNTVIYGYVFILGSDELKMAGNAIVHGGVATTSGIEARGNATIIYNPTLLSNLQIGSGSTTYARVPGSWKDF